MVHLLSSEHRRFEVYFQISLKAHLDAITKKPGLIHNGGVVCIAHVAHRLCNNLHFILMQTQPRSETWRGGGKV